MRIVPRMPPPIYMRISVGWLEQALNHEQRRSSGRYRTQGQFRASSVTDPPVTTLPSLISFAAANDYSSDPRKLPSENFTLYIQYPQPSRTRVARSERRPP